MAILKKDPEKEAAKQREAEERGRLQAEAEFQRSPQGQARAAKAAGRQLFQLALPIAERVRTFAGVLGGDQTMKTKESDPTEVIELVEREGWRLQHVGYVFQETGSVSRDKLLSTGQTASVTGSIVGIYLFRSAG